jgi:diacylglycerol O-acyltransferase / wax synthase
VLAIHEATQHAKEIADAIGARTLTEISAAMPGALFSLAARATSRNQAKGSIRRIQNTVVSNVPGPQEPLYNCGARMISLYAAGPLSNGMGLFHLVATYNDRFTLTAFASSEMLPDAMHYGACIDKSYAALASVLQ